MTSRQQQRLLLSVPYISKASAPKEIPLAPLPSDDEYVPPAKSRYVRFHHDFSDQKLKRMECNRKAAAASRERRKRHVDQLERENAELRREIEELRRQLYAIIEAKKVEQVKETEGK